MAKKNNLLIRIGFSLFLSFTNINVIGLSYSSGLIAGAMTRYKVKILQLV